MAALSNTRHILHANQFDVDFLGELFEQAAWMDRQLKAGKLDELAGILRRRRMFSLFFEPSTRTRFSFESAADLLGMRVRASENAGEFSSRIKGESDIDAFRVLAGYGPDVIVVRHDGTDQLPAIAADLDAAGFSVPLVNAGDGSGQHPTQALLDVYTIQAELGRLDNLNVVMVGDLANGRTARSLTYLLAKYPGNRLTFVTPPGLEMREDIKKYLSAQNVGYVDSHDLTDALSKADVVYVTRIQVERLPGELAELPETYKQVAGRYRITPRELNLLSRNARVLHPLPRVGDSAKQRVKRNGEAIEVTLMNELAPECDTDPRAAYFRQARNGLLTRMALLQWVVTGKF